MKENRIFSHSYGRILMQCLLAFRNERNCNETFILVQYENQWGNIQNVIMWISRCLFDILEHKESVKDFLPILPENFILCFLESYLSWRFLTLVFAMYMNNHLVKWKKFSINDSISNHVPLWLGARISNWSLSGQERVSRTEEHRWHLNHNGLTEKDKPGLQRYRGGLFSFMCVVFSMWDLS